MPASLSMFSAAIHRPGRAGTKPRLGASSQGRLLLPHQHVHRPARARCAKPQRTCAAIAEPASSPRKADKTEKGGKGGKQYFMAPYPRSSIIATVGPNTPIDECVEAGMRIMRLNCSHGDSSFYRSKVETLRDLQAGDHVILTTDTEFRTTGVKNGVPEVFIDYANVAEVLDVGSPVYIDDGLLQLQVVSVAPGRVECVAQNSGPIGERKGVNLPGAILDLPAVSEKDIQDIQLAAEMEADFIFASFVRKAEHVTAVRDILIKYGSPGTKIISKIENQEGLDNFAEILEESDGIMVARGDLGIEIPAHEVVTAQKYMIAECNAVGKPVVCATQMLESMVNNPRPTRAEVSDVANAVLDGADCVMLSGETAKGKYPVEAIDTMGRTCKEADSLVDYDELFHRMAVTPRRHSIVESVCAAAVRCALDEQASMIVVVTTSGAAARYVSKYRPPMPVLAATHSPMVARQSYMLRGITPLLLADMRHSALVCIEDSCSLDDNEVPELVLRGALEYGKRMGICSPGDTVVAVVASMLPNDDLNMRAFTVR
eukprot:jgi/Tetstr1/454406/TSEL_041307.t1